MGIFLSICDKTINSKWKPAKCVDKVETFQ